MNPDNVEAKNVNLPQEMQRAIARQAEAERGRRAKVVSAEGEFQASTRLHEAADILGKNPGVAAPVPHDARRDRHREEFDDRIPLPIDLVGVPARKGVLKATRRTATPVIPEWIIPLEGQYQRKEVKL